MDAVCYGQNEIRPCALASIRPCVRTSSASVRPLRPCVQYTWTTSSLSIGYGRIEICPTTDEMELVRTKKGTWHATCAWNYNFLTGVCNYNHLTGLCNKSLSQTKPNRRYGGALRPASCVHASYDDMIPPPVLFECDMRTDIRFCRDRSVNTSFAMGLSAFQLR